MPFASLGLRAELIRAVTEHGYDTPTPIQSQAIPVVLEGRDLMAGAQTGTGKTAGFALPVLQRLAARRVEGRRPIRALVLTPTRELAAQVGESIAGYGKYTRLRSTVIFGGVGHKPQADALRAGIDILVATPGRLLDHAGLGNADLSRLEILVLDEADRMLDMGFIHDLRRILKLLPQQRQNLLFSATYSEEVKQLAAQFLTTPALIEVARRNSTAETVTQVAYRVDADRKRALLSKLIQEQDWRQVLVFTRTKHGANRLAEALEKDGLAAAAIHGNKSQGARTRALAGFKSGEVRVLVATDIAARGLDIAELPHVVNYELPNVPEDYVHRIGRTGRAGCSGHAVSLVCGEERSYLAAIERLIKQPIEQTVLAGFEPSGVESSREAPPAPQRGRPHGGAPRGQQAGRPGQPQAGRSQAGNHQQQPGRQQQPEHGHGQTRGAAGQQRGGAAGQQRGSVGQQRGGAGQQRGATGQQRSGTQRSARGNTR